VLCVELPDVREAAVSRVALLGLASLALVALAIACGSNQPTPDPESCRNGGVYPWCFDLGPEDADGGFTLDGARDGS
jgi:hypothetical protein